MDREMIIVLDFGGQYNQLIARRVRECNVYCEVHPYNLGLDKIREMNPKGIIFTGGPDVVFEDGAPRCSKEIFELGVPVLFCAGDDACVAEARALFPGLAAVVTKEALSWTSALSRHPQAVCDDIYRTVRAAVPGAGTLVPYCMPGPLSVEIRYKRMEDAARAALTDRNGHPFAQPDPFTRSGVVDGVSALF